MCWILSVFFVIFLGHTNAWTIMALGDWALTHLGCPSTEPEWCGDTGWNGWNGFFLERVMCPCLGGKVFEWCGLPLHYLQCGYHLNLTQTLNRCHVETWLWGREATTTKSFEVIWSSLQAGCIFFVQDILLYIINFSLLFLYCTLTDLPVLFCYVF